MTDTSTYEHHDRDASAGTRRAYEYAWRRYLIWCATEDREPWDDPDGSTFAAFVAAMVRAGLKASTLRQCRAAVVYRYRVDPALYGLADPTKTDKARAEMKSIARRDRGRRVRKALPMTPDILEQVLAVSSLRRSGESVERAVARHLEAEAVLRTMFDAALRCDDMIRAEWGDLSPDPAGNGHRTLYVKPGKTGHDRHGNISPPTWAALQRWAKNHPDGTAGRITTASTAQALGERIRRLGAVAGIPLSGHSPRRGVATTLAQAGATEQELRAVGGWRSPQMVSEYCDAPHAATNAVARLYGPETAKTQHDATETVGLPLARAQGALVLAASCARRHPALADDPAVLAARELVFELWPVPGDSPPDCARPGCPGLILTIERRDSDRWCSTACRTKRTTG